MPPHGAGVGPAPDLEAQVAEQELCLISGQDRGGVDTVILLGLRPEDAAVCL
jgi:hypothetical protein